ncbi:MAG: SOS response-associated peptidase [Planctomycetaceae bacterium]
MCHRFNQKASPVTVGQTFQAEHVRTAFAQQKDLFPLADVPIVRLDEQGDREIVTCSWGLLPFWWKPSDRQRNHRGFQRMTFNARGETVHEKPTFRAAFKTRRCLIPWTEFFEHGWYFSLHSDTVPGQTVSAFAGLWESWNCHETGSAIDSCTIITTAANSLLEQYHPKKRMPVILADAEACRRWLSPDTVERQSIEDLFHPLNADLMVHRKDNSRKH